MLKSHDRFSALFCFLDLWPQKLCYGPKIPNSSHSIIKKNNNPTRTVYRTCRKLSHFTQCIIALVKFGVTAKCARLDLNADVSARVSTRVSVAYRVRLIAVDLAVLYCGIKIN